MAVATDFQDLRTGLSVTHYLSGNASTAKDMGWVDMRDYDAILITVHAAALTGNGVTVFSIIANADSAGGDTDATIKTHAVASAPDAAGDYLVLEASAAEIQGASTSTTGALRYVSAAVTAANAADNIAVTYVRKAKHSKLNLTADSVA